MLVSELWHDYLTTINTMASYKGMYGLDQKRVEIHEKLKAHYANMGLFKGFMPERFDGICHHLNAIIDFKPPLKKWDSINNY